MDTERFWSHLEQSDDLTQWDDQDAAFAECCLRLVDAVRADGGGRADERRAILFALHQWYEPQALAFAGAVAPIMPDLVEAVRALDTACVEALS